MNVNFDLPPGYSLAYQEDMQTEAVEDILNAVAATADPHESRYYPPSARELAGYGTSSGSERMALGILDDEDRLVVYTAATIDEEESHASVDTLVVRGNDRGRDLSKIAIEIGLSLLDTTGVKTIGFEPWGQVGKVVPYLVTKKGFRYNPAEGEFISHREAAGFLNGLVAGPEEVPGSAMSAVAQEVEVGIEEIGEEETEDFIGAVDRLVMECTEHVNSQHPHMPIVANNTDFSFKYKGRTIYVARSKVAGCTDWRVTDMSEEAITSEEGVVINSERNYSAWKVNGQVDTPAPDYGETLEKDGKVPYFSQGVFTMGRYDTVMNIMSSLGVEHLVSFEER